MLGISARTFQGLPVDESEPDIKEVTEEIVVV